MAGGFAVGLVFSSLVRRCSQRKRSSDAETPSMKSPVKLLRRALVMSVKEACEAEYERRHSPIWEELHATLTAHGAHNYSIYLHPGTRQLFA